MQGVRLDGSISRLGRLRASATPLKPSTNPPSTGTKTARVGSSESWAESRCPGASPNSNMCRKSTSPLMAATTSPPIAPMAKARTIRLNSRARTNARKRRGASNDASTHMTSAA